MSEGLQEPRNSIGNPSGGHGFNAGGDQMEELGMPDPADELMNLAIGGDDVGDEEEIVEDDGEVVEEQTTTTTTRTGRTKADAPVKDRTIIIED